MIFKCVVILWLMVLSFWCIGVTDILEKVRDLSLEMAEIVSKTMRDS